MARRAPPPNTGQRVHDTLQIIPSERFEWCLKISTLRHLKRNAIAADFPKT